LKQIIGEEKEH
jgi:hypothetical protein